jgi:hypothetical protein
VKSMAQQIALEAALEFRRGFRLEVGVSRIVRDQARSIRSVCGADLGQARRRGREGLQPRGCLRLHAIRAVGTSKPERVEPIGVREERLVGDDPGETRLGINDLLKVGTEGAVLILASGNREEQAISHRELFLRVVAEGLHGSGLLRGKLYESRRGLEGRGAWRQAASLRKLAVLL